MCGGVGVRAGKNVCAAVLRGCACVGGWVRMCVLCVYVRMHVCVWCVCVWSP